MKNLFSLTVSILLLTGGCGGVIGSIKKYRFDVQKERLDEAIHIILNENPQMQKPDSIYGLSQSELEKLKDNYCVLVDNNNNRYIVKFSFVGDPVSWANSTKTEISLASGAKYGEILFLESKISLWDKRKYSRLFEEQFISKLKEELNSKSYP